MPSSTPESIAGSATVPPATPDRSPVRSLVVKSKPTPSQTAPSIQEVLDAAISDVMVALRQEQIDRARELNVIRVNIEAQQDWFSSELFESITQSEGKLRQESDVR